MNTSEENNKTTISTQYSKFQDYIFGLFFTIVFASLIYLSTSTLASLISHKVAITSDYAYAKIAPFSVDEPSFYVMIIFGIFYFFIICHTVFSWLNRKSWSKSIFYTIIVLIPVGMVTYQYKNTDEFMYSSISHLYDNAINANPNFAKSSIGIKFSTALLNHDYTTLKEISNNLDTITEMDFKSNKIIEIIDLLPTPQSAATFKTMLNKKESFVSIADYQKFYDALMVEFKTSESSHKKEFIFLIDMINPNRYYTPNVSRFNT